MNNKKNKKVEKLKVYYLKKKITILLMNINLFFIS